MRWVRGKERGRGHGQRDRRRGRRVGSRRLKNGLWEGESMGEEGWARIGQIAQLVEHPCV